MKLLIFFGFVAIELFLFLRTLNLYGDASHWFNQRTTAFSFLSYFNVTKYPPSFLYMLITLGPAIIFLAVANKPLNRLGQKIAVFGRVPFFYYVVHIYLIHFIALIAAQISGFKWSDMILSNKVNRVPELKGFGFNLLTVYLIWIMLILILYPFCKWYDRYKRAHLPAQKWLSYM
jgi:hypothetical protein